MGQHRDSELHIQLKLDYETKMRIVAVSKQSSWLHTQTSKFVHEGDNRLERRRNRKLVLGRKRFVPDGRFYIGTQKARGFQA